MSIEDAMVRKHNGNQSHPESTDDQFFLQYTLEITDRDLRVDVDIKWL